MEDKRARKICDDLTDHVAKIKEQNPDMTLADMAYVFGMCYQECVDLLASQGHYLVAHGVAQALIASREKRRKRSRH